MRKMLDLGMLQAQAGQSMQEIIDCSKIKRGNILVVGCSTSEVCGSKIGTDSNETAAGAIMEGLLGASLNDAIFLAIQCCEHLNRALVVERQCAERYNLDVVSVIPVPHAGGALASVAMKSFVDPVIVENVQATAGIDIGHTMIGMHIKSVVVPVRLTANVIGEALVVGAYTRPKLIGGERAYYGQNHIR